MASGKPIIGSISGEANKIINLSNCGFASEAEDYKKLVKNVERFIRNQDQRNLINEIYVQNFKKLSTISISCFSLSKMNILLTGGLFKLCDCKFIFR